MTSSRSILSLRFAAVLLCLALAAAGVRAQYTVAAFSGDVKVKHAGKIVPAEKDMRVGAFDIIIIGEGASATIFDKASSSEYTRDIAGEISPNNLVIEAKKAAGSNFANIHRNVGIGKGNTEEEGKMYVEKGKITLALEEYDPAGDEIMIDARVLAEYIVNSLNSIAPERLGDNFPVTIRTAAADGALHFQLDNTTSEPLYINVIKLVTDAGGRRSIRISELGQPVGCYVILPCQAIMRSQTRGACDGEVHLLVATHYYFSIDELLEHIAAGLADNNATHKPSLELPIYLKAF